MKRDELLAEMQRVMPERELAWSDPPPSNQGNHTIIDGERRARYVVIASLLRLVPGEWLKIGPFSRESDYAAVRKRLMVEGFESVNRRLPDGVFFFVRWPK